jgi:hypothetical protein
MAVLPCAPWWTCVQPTAHGPQPTDYGPQATVGHNREVRSFARNAIRIVFLLASLLIIHHRSAEDTTLFSALLTEGTECYHYHRGAVCFYCVYLSMTDGVTLFSNTGISQSQIISH